MINRILFRLNKRLLPVFPRPSTAFAKRHFGNRPIKCAEIGVYAGHNALSILRELNVREFWLVDPYINYASEVGPVEAAEEDARRRMSRFRDRTHFVKKMSDDAVADVQPVDFIYIDGNHTYSYVKADLANYWPKIKRDGILSGHDFDYRSPGVIKAVTEFCGRKKLTLQTFESDWWIVKG